MNEILAEVLESAARAQRLVGSDMVLVGGSAAAYYAGHRASYDHDHVLMEFGQRFEIILDALESEGDWVTNRVTPGKIILGSLGGIETGIRQLIRKVPLEFSEVTLPSGNTLRIPTAAEILRIKAFLIVRRNQVRDFLDVAALSDLHGLGESVTVLRQIDDYYTDPARDDQPVLSQLARQLAEPTPKDSRTIGQLTSYKGLAERWQNWSEVVSQCQLLAQNL